MSDALVMNPSANGTIGGGGRVAVGCKYAGSKWHLWVDAQSLKVDGDTLYRRSDSPAAKVYRLRASAKANADLVRALLSDAPRQINALRDVENKNDARSRAAAEKLEAQERVRDAAPYLLETLGDLLAFLDSNRMQVSARENVPLQAELELWKRNARAAIAKARPSAPRAPRFDWQECPNCRGHGTVAADSVTASGVVEQDVACRRCDGNGAISNERKT